VKTFALILVASIGCASGCAGSKFFHKPTVAQYCPNEDLDGPVTLASTPDVAPYGADPLKTFSCGAPPR